MTPRTCGWCDRTTTDYIIREIETDRGPDHIVWCKDVNDCRAARATSARRRWALNIRKRLHLGKRRR
jgi:hypothetical protein